MRLKTSKNRSRCKRVGIIVGPNREQVMETVRSVDWNADIEFIYQYIAHLSKAIFKLKEEPLDLDITLEILEGELKDKGG